MSCKIKLVKGKSYNGHGIAATKKQPEVTTDEATAKVLVASGFFAYENVQESADKGRREKVEKKAEEKSADSGISSEPPAQTGITSKKRKKAAAAVDADAAAET